MRKSSRPSLFLRTLQAIALATVFHAAAATPPPALFYSDLESGPNVGGINNKGAFVTIWGKHLGRDPGAVTVGGGRVEEIVSWTESKVVFQLGARAATGSIVLTDAAGAQSNGIPFTVRAGRIFVVSPDGQGDGSLAHPASPRAVYENMRAGDTYYFRAGAYTGVYGFTTYGDANYVLGPGHTGAPGAPVAFVAYPGEHVVFQGHALAFQMRDNDPPQAHADYVTVTGITMTGAVMCVNGSPIAVAGGQVANSGGRGIRTVGNVCSATYTGNTAAALIVAGGNDNIIYGNEFKDTGTNPPINQNHIVYVDDGASNVDIGWNYFHDNRVGHVIQVHTDKAFTYRNILIHDNVITCHDVKDCRGINIGNVAEGSYGAIYNNVLYHLGQDFSGIAIYGGSWKIYNNTLYDIFATGGLIWLGNQYARPTPASAEIYNNILVSDGRSTYIGTLAGATAAQIRASHNLYFGRTPSFLDLVRDPGINKDESAVRGDPMLVDPAHGDFHLRPGSPAIGRGTIDALSIAPRDHDGIQRGQGRPIDIGAFEAFPRETVAPAR